MFQWKKYIYWIELKTLLQNEKLLIIGNFRIAPMFSKCVCCKGLKKIYVCGKGLDLIVRGLGIHHSIHCTPKEGRHGSLNMLLLPSLSMYTNQQTIRKTLGLPIFVVYFFISSINWRFTKAHVYTWNSQLNGYENNINIHTPTYTHVQPHFRTSKINLTHEQ